MLQNVQSRDFLQIRKINVTDTICTMKTVHRVIHLWHLSVMRNYLIVRILRVTREKRRIGGKGKGRGIGESKLYSLFPFALSPVLFFADLVFMDPTFFGIFVCGPLQSFVVNVFTSGIAYVAGIWNGRGKLKGFFCARETRDRGFPRVSLPPKQLPFRPLSNACHAGYIKQ